MPQQSLSFFLKTSLLAWIAVVHTPVIAVDPPEKHQDQKVDMDAMMQRVGALREQGEYAKAIEAGRSAVTIAEKTFGRDDRRTGTAKRALAAA